MQPPKGNKNAFKFKEIVNVMNQIAKQLMDSIIYCISLVCALGLAFWCISEYAKNEEVTEILFQTFNSGEEGRQYPSMTLCLADSYKEFAFSKHKNSTIDTNSYSKFLEGKQWHNDMLSIDYDSVTISVREYIIGTCILTTSSPSVCHEFGEVKHFTRTSTQGVMKCFSFKYDAKGIIDEAYIAINNSIYPNGIRPRRRFKIMFHYPDQITKGLKNLFYNWPLRNNPMDEYYSMTFDISNPEILKRRKNGREQCYDWKDYDVTTSEEVMRSVGCRPPYWKSRFDYPSCLSQLQLKNMTEQYLAKQVSDDQFQKYVPPCIEITKMDVEFGELPGEYEQFAYETVYKRFIKDAGTARGWFVINTKLWKSTYFKEIKKVRAYSFQSMIGNSGGYIGLMVGITICDLFCFASRFYFAMKGTHWN